MAIYKVMTPYVRPDGEYRESSEYIVSADNELEAIARVRAGQGRLIGWLGRHSIPDYMCGAQVSE